MESIEKALSGYQDTISFVADTNEKRMKVANNHFKNRWFSRLDYVKLHKTISTATASRDLKAAVDNKWLDKQGDKIQQDANSKWILISSWTDSDYMD